MRNESTKIPINKEIREYTESIFMRLSLRQCIFSGIACLVAIGVYFLCHDSLGTEITSWLCIMSAVPFGAIGFIKIQGLNAEILLIELWHSFLLSKVEFVDEPINLYLDLYKDYIDEKEGMKNVKKSNKGKTTKKRKV